MLLPLPKSLSQEGGAYLIKLMQITSFSHERRGRLKIFRAFSPYPLGEGLG